MSKKLFNKEGRAFLNARDKSCQAVVTWQVLLYPKFTEENYSEPPHISGSFSTNEEGQSHYVSRRGDLRPLQVLQRELNKFNQAYDEAEKMLEELNAKSKDTD